MRILEGKLISLSSKNTAIVEVYRVKPHPLYGKLIRLSKKYKVDNTGFEDIALGIEVKIQETRPMSKQKYFKIISVIEKKELKKKSKKTEEKIEKETKPKKASRKV